MNQYLVAGTCELVGRELRYDSPFSPPGADRASVRCRLTNRRYMRGLGKPHLMVFLPGGNRIAKTLKKRDLLQSAPAGLAEEHWKSPITLMKEYRRCNAVLQRKVEEPRLQGLVARFFYEVREGAPVPKTEVRVAGEEDPILTTTRAWNNADSLFCLVEQVRAAMWLKERLGVPDVWIESESFGMAEFGVKHADETISMFGFTVIPPGVAVTWAHPTLYGSGRSLHLGEFGNMDSRTPYEVEKWWETPEMEQWIEETLGIIGVMKSIQAWYEPHREKPQSVLEFQCWGERNGFAVDCRSYLFDTLHEFFERYALLEPHGERLAANGLWHLFDPSTPMNEVMEFISA